MSLSASKILSEVEHRQLQETLEKYEKGNFRDSTLIWVLLHTGARVSEVLAIRKCDIIEQGMRVFIRGLKNSNDREIPMTPFLFNRLKVLAEKLEDSGKIFPIGYNRAREIWCEWRPAKKRIHSLRHYRAVEIFKKTKNVLLVKRVLGHKDLATTMIYLEYEQGDDELRRALM